MSDFDKEAEREKLRKKYEEDRKDREATQRMSDLLLKGARMTNTHCGTCGDPLFEQNDVTFCPTCHGGPEGVEASLDEADAQASGEGTSATDEAAADAAATETEDASTDAAREVEVRTTDEGSDGADDRDAQPRPSSQAERRPPAKTSSSRSADDSTSRTPTRDDRARVSPASVSGDLEAARDALVESLERFARRAAETDDPRYATECLQAAREASEALENLR